MDTITEQSLVGLSWIANSESALPNERTNKQHGDRLSSINRCPSSPIIESEQTIPICSFFNLTLTRKRLVTIGEKWAISSPYLILSDDDDDEVKSRPIDVARVEWTASHSFFEHFHLEDDSTDSSSLRHFEFDEQFNLSW
jgi:hypothetical protein